MHDWYISSTSVEALTGRMIGTCFMEDLSYMYGTHHFVVLVHSSTLIYGITLFSQHWYLLDT
jgi:hypothetical protein